MALLSGQAFIEAGVHAGLLWSDDGQAMRNNKRPTALDQTAARAKSSGRRQFMIYTRLLGSGLAALLLALTALPAAAQSFRVQCPTHTTLHPLVDAQRAS